MYIYFNFISLHLPGWAQYDTWLNRFHLMPICVPLQYLCLSQTQAIRNVLQTLQEARILEIPNDVIVLRQVLENLSTKNSSNQ